MALKSEIGYSKRTAQVIANAFSTAGADLYFFIGTMPNPINLTGTAPSWVDLASYSAQQIGISSDWSYNVTEEGVLEFKTSDYPPIVTSVLTGTLGWCVMIGNNQSQDGSIVGTVSLSGGTGLVQIANDEAGGGVGLAVVAGDNISVTSFGLKWEI